ncbi:transcription factor-like 5 protein [Dendrobates tinctorius]|uniref:transcription factor-like 5 protein n=1 Tax=Dendrobates tinctorius TaxID=92724 RepID=UPI003CC92484
MFEPTQAHTAASTCPAASSDPSSCVGEDVVNVQAPSIADTDLGIVELSESEYTQLHQLLCSHTDCQSNEGDGATRMSIPFVPSSNLPNAPQYPSTSGSEGQSGLPVVYPLTDDNKVHTNPTLVHVDFQGLKVMMLGDSSLPPPSGDMAEKHLNNASGDSLGATPMRVKSISDIIELNKENENLGFLSETRMKSTVRVRLEDIFNRLPTDVPRCTEAPESSVNANTLVTIFRHPSPVIGTQQPGKWTPLVKNKAALSTLQLVNPNLNLQDTTPLRNADPHLTQPSSALNWGASCPLLEAAKNQEISLSRDFSFCYQQDIESAKQNLKSENNLFPTKVLIKVDDTLCKQPVKKRSRSRIYQLVNNMERRVLSDIKNTSQGMPLVAPQGNTAEVSDSKQIGLSLRRERHNRMERDRRRRIRVCCDELNNLVPFCTVETDKATTLQWTTAFLKHIQERHGDTLKKEFEAVFSGETGMRLKVSRSEGAKRGTVQEEAGSSSFQNISNRV